MRNICVIAALLAVAGCSKPAPAPDADTSAAPEQAAAATPENIAADGKPSVGKFKVTTSKGEVLIDEVKADGTYVTTKDGKVVETGKWEQKSRAQYCYTKDEKDAKQECSDEKVENGVYTSKNAKGEVVTVERIEG
jgi:predicted small lipoprotein YifL